MFLYYKYVQFRAKHGQLFRYVLLFKVLRGVFFLIVIRILLHTNIIKGVASAKYFPLLFHAFLFSLAHGGGLVFGIIQTFF